MASSVATWIIPHAARHGTPQRCRGKKEVAKAAPPPVASLATPGFTRRTCSRPVRATARCEVVQSTVKHPRPGQSGAPRRGACDPWRRRSSSKRGGGWISRRNFLFHFYQHARAQVQEQDTPHTHTYPTHHSHLLYFVVPLSEHEIQQKRTACALRVGMAVWP